MVRSTVGLQTPVGRPVAVSGSDHIGPSGADTKQDENCHRFFKALLDRMVNGR
jgi:hypothetical protein